jgi:hypothetical protein
MIAPLPLNGCLMTDPGTPVRSLCRPELARDADGVRKASGASDSRLRAKQAPSTGHRPQVSQPPRTRLSSPALSPEDQVIPRPIIGLMEIIIPLPCTRSPQDQSLVGLVPRLEHRANRVRLAGD